MLRVVAITALFLGLTGCLSVAKMMGHDYTDPNRTLVLMHIHAPNASFDSVHFNSLGGGDGASILQMDRDDNDCLVMASVMVPDRYGIGYLKFNYQNTEFTTYDFGKDGPAVLTFSAASGAVQYLGGYRVEVGDDSFEFNPTSHCGGEADALSVYQAEVLDEYPKMFSKTVWPERVAARRQAVNRG